MKKEKFNIYKIKMKKILVVNNKYKIKGGEDSNIIDEVKLLKSKYKVSYLEFDNSKKINFFDVLAFFTNSNFYSNYLFKKKVDSFEPDIVYLHNLWFKGNLGIIRISHKKKIQTLVKVHNFRYHCANSFLIKRHLDHKSVCNACNLKSSSNNFFNKYFEESFIKSIFLIIYIKKLLKLIKNYNIKILTITEFHQKFLMDLNIKSQNLFYYPNPIQRITSLGSVDSIKSKQIIYAGRLSVEKGIRELLQTWSSLDLNDYILSVYGTGPLENELLKKFSNKNIKFYGDVENSEVLNAIANSKAVVTSTKMFEGQPRLLSEASILGIPSIFPLFGGMGEFFPNDYSYAFEQFNYVDLQKKIINLFDDEIYNYEKNRVQNYIISKLDEEKQLEIFSEILIS